MGFDNGIVVGSQAAAHSNVLFNIYGDTVPPPPPNGQVVINVITIPGANSVTDLSIMGVANAGGGSTRTISDGVTSTNLADPYIAMYSLGRPTSGGYSRFTTSPNATTWVVGSAAPTPLSPCPTGSLYSNIGSATNIAALYVCTVGRTSSWTPVK